MGDMLSQAEIDALLNGTGFDNLSASTPAPHLELTSQEVDALGEIGNISMGTSATTLFTLLGQKVLITTPAVTITSWEEMAKEYVLPLVAVRVEYTHGLMGSNLLLMKERDVKIITDLMMGGEGKVAEGELTDLHLSAISEAMNQMVGSSATSMSSMFNKRIDISPPKAFLMQFDAKQPYSDFDSSQKIVKIAFKMVVGDLIDSEIMQLLPISFAKNLVENLLNMETANQVQTPPAGASGTASSQPAGQQFVPPPMQPQAQGRHYQEQSYGGFQQPQQNYNAMGNTPQGYLPQEMHANSPNVNVQPAQFQSFDDSRVEIERKNIGMIMDVPLQVTVELGRTNKLIKDVLEFGPGSIIELDKLAGEPVDILVNGKIIAKGEVVVIDESFGVRITDIIHPSKRL
ncbi:MAG: flagellar motor switch phosphatase FliY [Clostridiales bacterium]|jgi:flagellar motor switch protein FliN/FliY|nr:flagellar motor switch phosphatase FliY [Eubacteriales bacterium]MDH7565010.1 flagellar motor switch phosphatase FliY [Clostridiales bacterium]